MNNENQNQNYDQNYSINNQQEHSDNLAHVVNAPSSQSNSSAIKKVKRISAWVLIFSAILFALLAIMSIWGVFSSSSVAWRFAISLEIIAILIVDIEARIYKGKSR